MCVRMRKIMLLGAVCLWPFIGFNHAQAQSVTDTLQRVYKTNPQLDAERAKQRAVDENVAQSWSSMRPNISASAAKGVESIDITPGTKRYLGSSASFGLSASQTLFNGFQTFNNVKSAEAKVQAGQALLVDSEQNLMLNAITAHASVVRDREIVELRKNGVSIFQLLYDAAAMRHKIGEISITDVRITQGRLQLAQAELSRAQATLALSESDYQKYVGVKPGKLQPVAPARAMRPESLDKAILAAVSDNPALKAAQASEVDAMFAKHSAVGALSPTLSVQGNLSQEHNPVANVDRRDTASTSLRLSMPIFDGGLTHSRVRQAKSVEIQRQYEAQNVRQLVSAGVEGVWRQSQESSMRLDALGRQVQATEQAFEGVKAEYRAGERSIYEILDSQRDVIEAKVTYADAKKDRAVTSYALLAVMGKLNAKALALNVKHYNPTKHSKAIENTWVGLDNPKYNDDEPSASLN